MQIRGRDVEGCWYRIGTLVHLGREPMLTARDCSDRTEYDGSKIQLYSGGM